MGDSYQSAAERQREDRLKALARRNAAQAPQRPSPREGGDLRETAQEPPGSAPLTPQGAAVDDRIRSLMRDPRTWRERDPGLLDHVTRQWARAYPGMSLHTGFKRLDPQRAIRPIDVEPWPPQPPQATTLERRWDDPSATVRTSERRPYGREEAPIYLTELDSSAETDASRPARAGRAGNAETDGQPGSASDRHPRGGRAEGRFPWTLHDPDAGAPSTLDPSNGTNGERPYKGFDAPAEIAVLTDPRTDERG
ncbi:MAG: hypothetical protein RIB45_13245 [Marivibrio sp.]|uniref:hypothetical protein n=1 Tax=Marivibrio sp. TaxID=2039719 RepID=UPI0032EDBBF7